jgi:hypothetical protein
LPPGICEKVLKVDETSEFLTSPEKRACARHELSGTSPAGRELQC